MIRHNDPLPAVLPQVVELDDRAGLGPRAFAGQLDRLNDGERELIPASVKPGPSERRGFNGIRNSGRPVVIVHTADIRSWEALLFSPEAMKTLYPE